MVLWDFKETLNIVTYLQYVEKFAFHNETTECKPHDTVFINFSGSRYNQIGFVPYT